MSTEVVTSISNRVMSLEDIIRQQEQTVAAVLQRLRDVEQYAAAEARAREQAQQQLVQLVSERGGSSAEAAKQFQSLIQQQHDQLGALQADMQGQAAALRGVNDKYDVALRGVEQRVQADVGGVHHRAQAGEAASAEAVRNLHTQLQAVMAAAQAAEARSRDDLVALQQQMSGEVAAQRQRTDTMESAMRDALRDVHGSVTGDLRGVEAQQRSALESAILRISQSLEALDQRNRTDMSQLHAVEQGDVNELGRRIEELERNLRDTIQASANTLASEVAQVAQHSQALDRRQATAHQTVLQQLAKHDAELESVDLNWRASVTGLAAMVKDDLAATQSQMNAGDEGLRQQLRETQDRLVAADATISRAVGDLQREMQARCVAPLQEAQRTLVAHDHRIGNVTDGQRQTQDSLEAFAMRLDQELAQFKQVVEGAIRASHADLLDRVNGAYTVATLQEDPDTARVTLHSALHNLWEDAKNVFLTQGSLNDLQGQILTLESAVRIELCQMAERNKELQASMNAVKVAQQEAEQKLADRLRALSPTALTAPDSTRAMRRSPPRETSPSPAPSIQGHSANASFDGAPAMVTLKAKESQLPYTPRSVNTSLNNAPLLPASLLLKDEAEEPPRSVTFLRQSQSADLVTHDLPTPIPQRRPSASQFDSFRTQEQRSAISRRFDSGVEATLTSGASRPSAFEDSESHRPQSGHSSDSRRDRSLSYPGRRRGQKEDDASQSQQDSIDTSFDTEDAAVSSSSDDPEAVNRDVDTSVSTPRSSHIQAAREKAGEEERQREALVCSPSVHDSQHVASVSSPNRADKSAQMESKMLLPEEDPEATHRDMATSISDPMGGRLRAAKEEEERRRAKSVTSPSAHDNQMTALSSNRADKSAQMESKMLLPEEPEATHRDVATSISSPRGVREEDKRGASARPRSAPTHSLREARPSVSAFSPAGGNGSMHRQSRVVLPEDPALPLRREIGTSITDPMGAHTRAAQAQPPRRSKSADDASRRGAPSPNRVDKSIQQESRMLREREEEGLENPHKDAATSISNHQGRGTRSGRADLPASRSSNLAPVRSTLDGSPSNADLSLNRSHHSVQEDPRRDAATSITNPMGANARASPRESQSRKPAAVPSVRGGRSSMSPFSPDRVGKSSRRVSRMFPYEEEEGEKESESARKDAATSYSVPRMSASKREVVEEEEETSAARKDAATSYTELRSDEPGSRKKSSVQLSGSPRAPSTRGSPGGSSMFVPNRANQPPRRASRMLLDEVEAPQSARRDMATSYSVPRPSVKPEVVEEEELEAPRRDMGTSYSIPRSSVHSVVKEKLPEEPEDPRRDAGTSYAPPTSASIPAASDAEGRRSRSAPPRSSNVAPLSVSSFSPGSGNNSMHHTPQMVTPVEVPPSTARHDASTSFSQPRQVPHPGTVEAPAAQRSRSAPPTQSLHGSRATALEPASGQSTSRARDPAAEESKVAPISERVDATSPTSQLGNDGNSFLDDADSSQSSSGPVAAVRPSNAALSVSAFSPGDGDVTSQAPSQVVLPEEEADIIAERQKATTSMSYPIDSGKRPVSNGAQLYSPINSQISHNAPIGVSAYAPQGMSKTLPSLSRVALPNIQGSSGRQNAATSVSRPMDARCEQGEAPRQEEGISVDPAALSHPAGSHASHLYAPRDADAEGAAAPSPEPWSGNWPSNTSAAGEPTTASRAVKDTAPSAVLPSQLPPRKSSSKASPSSEAPVEAGEGSIDHFVVPREPRSRRGTGLDRQRFTPPADVIQPEELPVIVPPSPPPLEPVVIIDHAETDRLSEELKRVLERMAELEARLREQENSLLNPSHQLSRASHDPERETSTKMVVEAPRPSRVHLLPLVDTEEEPSHEPEAQEMLGTPTGDVFLVRSQASISQSPASARHFSSVRDDSPVRQPSSRASVTSAVPLYDSEEVPPHRRRSSATAEAALPTNQFVRKREYSKSKEFTKHEIDALWDEVLQMRQAQGTQKDEVLQTVIAAKDHVMNSVLQIVQRQESETMGMLSDIKEQLMHMNENGSNIQDIKVFPVDNGGNLESFMRALQESSSPSSSATAPSAGATRTSLPVARRVSSILPPQPLQVDVVEPAHLVAQTNETPPVLEQASQSFPDGTRAVPMVPLEEEFASVLAPEPHRESISVPFEAAAPVPARHPSRSLSAQVQAPPPEVLTMAAEPRFSEQYPSPRSSVPVIPQLLPRVMRPHMSMSSQADLAESYRTGSEAAFMDMFSSKSALQRSVAQSRPQGGAPGQRLSTWSEVATPTSRARRAVNAAQQQGTSPLRVRAARPDPIRGLSPIPSPVREGKRSSPRQHQQRRHLRETPPRGHQSAARAHHLQPLKHGNYADEEEKHVTPRKHRRSPSPRQDADRDDDSHDDRSRSRGQRGRKDRQPVPPSDHMYDRRERPERESPTRRQLPHALPTMPVFTSMRDPSLFDVRVDDMSSQLGRVLNRGASEDGQLHRIHLGRVPEETVRQSHVRTPSPRREEPVQRVAVDAGTRVPMKDSGRHAISRSGGDGYRSSGEGPVRVSLYPLREPRH